MIKRIKRVRVGDELTTEWLNWLAEQVERANNVKFGIGFNVQDMPHGLLVGLSESGVVRPALTPSGGIPAATGTNPITPGSATCTLYEDTGTTLVPVTSVVVFNKYSVVVAGTKRIDVYRWNGKWWQCTEQC